MSKINSAVISGALMDELERSNSMIKRYSEELEKLPKGSIVVRNFGNQSYVYLARREDGKVVSKYLGKDDAVDISALKKELEKRKVITKTLKNLKQEKTELERLLK